MYYQAARVSAGDLRRFSETVQALYRCTVIDGLPGRMVDLVGSLLRSSSTHYSELNPVSRHILTVTDQEPDNMRALTPEFLRLMHQHPVIRHHRTTGDGSAHRVSDLMSDRAFHRLPLYNEAYRRVGLEHQMSVTLPSPKPILIGVVVHRTRDDIEFSARDRLLMNMLRPHLVQAHENATRFEQVSAELASARGALEAIEQGVVVLHRNLTVKTWTRRAWVVAHRHFVGEPPETNRLPETLETWAISQVRRDGRAPAVMAPFIKESEGARLTIRLIPDLAGGQFLLSFDERLSAPCAHAHKLESLDLTRREAEVLCWVCEGKTNREIAARLTMSARTVQKHLERIFAKLNVDTRTAAAAIASRLMSA
ncbi:MAG: helix-turn-helix transcriptional regulator [Tepidisphaeraceae bacterium]